MINRAEISDRLREFAKVNYGTMSGLAKALEMKPQALQVYLNGRSVPGFKLQEKLNSLGCDISWLLTGTQQIQNKSSKIRVETSLGGVLEYFIKGKKLDIKKISELTKVDTDLLEKYISNTKPIPLDILITICETTSDISMLDYVFRNSRFKIRWKKGER
jgi:hypothetical protein